MFLTIHAASGILISQTIKQPGLVFIISFLSHYFIDLIPHGDEGLGRWLHEKPKRLLWVELIDLFSLTAYIFIILTLNSKINTSLLIIGIFGAVLPDFLSELHHQSSNYLAPLHNPVKLLIRINFIKKFLEQHNNIHFTIHWLIKHNLPWRVGLCLQISISAILGGISLYL